MKNVISVLLLAATIAGCVVAQNGNNGRDKAASGNAQDQNDNGVSTRLQVNGNRGNQAAVIRGVLPLPPLQYPFPGTKNSNTTYTKPYSEFSTDCAPYSSYDGKTINAPVRQFALDMLMSVVKAKPRTNVVLSTFSIWSILLIILEGASGETANQIRYTLQLPNTEQEIRCNFAKLAIALKESSSSPYVEYDSQNVFFSDSHLPAKDDFLEAIRSPYNCEQRALNFSDPNRAVRDVNEWVKTSTKGRITKLLQAADLKTPAFIIANTVYFKGQWKYPFNKTATFQDSFYNEQREKIGTVNMMYQKSEFLYSFVSEIKSHVLDLPYADGRFRMLIILPKVNTKLEDALRDMKGFPIDACYDRLVRDQEMFSDSLVHVYLPRFKNKNKIVLNEYLKNMGIRNVFEAGVANFTKITDSVSHLGKIVHVAEIEVTEEGTTASAATGGVFVNRGAPPKFIANRPFAYFIVEESQKSVIFAGSVYNPTGAPESS